MSQEAARVVVAAFLAWTLVGAAFGAWFVLAGVQRVDAQARGAGLGFRLLILPGCIALWPLLLVHSLRAKPEPPLERNAHRDAARGTEAVIASLRRRHRAVFVAFATLLPLGLVAALGARREVPLAPALELESIADPAAGESVREGTASVRGVPMRLRAWRDARSGLRVIEVRAERDPEFPDVLLYASPARADDELPKDGVLLGTLAGTRRRRFVLPGEAAGTWLHWYSLGHQELLASAELPR